MMVEGSTTIPLWALPPRPGQAVTTMCFCTAPSAAPNLVLGRSNGSFEVDCVRSCFAAAAHRLTLSPQVYDCGEAGAPRRIFHKELGQSLCCLQVGRMCVPPSRPPFLPHRRFPHTYSCVGRWGPAHDEFIFTTFSGSVSCFSTAPRTENDFSEAMGGSASLPPAKSSSASATAAPSAPQPQPGVKLPGTATPLTQATDASDSAALSAKPLPKKELPPPPAPTSSSSSFFSAIGEKLGLGSGSSRSDAPATAADALRQQTEERAQGIANMHVRMPECIPRASIP
jgi:hypothetical protein